MSGYERIYSLLDKGTFKETHQELQSGNPLNFPDYEDKLKKRSRKNGLKRSHCNRNWRNRG